MKGETKTCPRCGIEFQCHNQKITACPCAEVPLNQQQLQYIGELYDGCLCVDCLKQVQKTFPAAISR